MKIKKCVNENIRQLDKDSQEKIRQEGTKANVDLEPVINAYVENQYASMKNGTFQKAFTEYIVRQHYGMNQVEDFRTKFDNWAKRDLPEGRAEAFERRDEIKQQIQEITEPIIQQSLENCDNNRTKPDHTKEQNVQRKYVQQMAIER
ncbi:hypothetical protein [Enterococcus faecalis]|uniref:hypothetical protein n=1 Tax=Enterococcus TaxID=1350 RepID=UPI0025AEE5BC|nr:hypothetical protein [Enterococcus faecalis]MDN3074371.1 hypothetical protein [Enterococcus faecalis]